jgi:hypothetical protein
MIAAFVFGMMGLSVSLWVGITYIGLTAGSVFYLVFVSNITGLISLLSTLQIEKMGWLRRMPVRGTFKAWLILGSLYFGILFGLCPQLRSLRPFMLLAIPLISSSGFSMILFGPIQDCLVSRKKR